VAKHQAACEPLQVQLAPALEDERPAIRAKIDAENDKLKIELQRITAREKLFHEERNKLPPLLKTPEVLEAELVRSASQPLRVAGFVANSARDWAMKRWEHARKQLEKWTDLLKSEVSDRNRKSDKFINSIGQLVKRDAPQSKWEFYYSERVARWTVEAQAAQSAHAEAVRESEAARRRCIDE
jgi:hypothetical protein